MIKWFDFGLFEIDMVSDPVTMTWRVSKLKPMSRVVLILTVYNRKVWALILTPVTLKENI